jgi:hypothetical protein
MSLKTTISSLTVGGLHVMLDEIRVGIIKPFFPMIVKKNLIILNSVSWPDALVGKVNEFAHSLAFFEEILSRNEIENAKKWGTKIHEQFHDFDPSFYAWL